MQKLKITLFVTVVIIFLLPIAWLTLTSFRPTVEIFNPNLVFKIPDFTLSHYEKAFRTYHLMKYLQNSLILCLSVVVIVQLIGLPAAYAFARWRFVGDSVALSIILLMRMFPVISVMVPLFILASKLRLLDTLIILILVHTAGKLPMAIWLLRSYIKEIPSSLEDAAYIDGCSVRQVITSVVLPLCWPGVAAAAAINFLFTWNDLLTALVLTSSLRAQPLTVGLSSFVLEFRIDWGPMAAAGFIGLLPAVIFMFFAGKGLIKGLVTGAVKG